MSTNGSRRLWSIPHLTTRAAKQAWMHSGRIIYRSWANESEETVSPLTSAESLAIAERKILEAMCDRRLGKELKLTAQAWVVLAR
jgi:hypothetical protein